MNATKQNNTMHLINRLRFEAHCSEEGQAFELRQNFAHTLQIQIAEVIDKVCSKHIAKDEWLQIDTLEIDLGHCSPHLLSQNFAQLFLAQFEKEFTKKIHTFTPQQRETSKQHSQLDLFRYFILHGSLPWWQDDVLVDLDTVIQQLHSLAPEQFRVLLYQYQEIQSVWIRMALQLSDQSKRLAISLIQELSEVEILLSHWVETFITDDIRFSEPAKTMAIARGLVLHHAPQLINNENKTTVIFQIIADMIRSIAPDTSEKRIETAQHSFNALQSFGVDNTTKEALSSIPSRSLTVDAEQPIQNSNTDLPARADTKIEQRYVVHHSGVILLAPFLKQFFTACQLLNGREWKHKEAQYQAIHLLKYLSAGSKKTPEYSLLLEKLLCGIAIEEPIPLDVGLQEYQLQEAQALLTSVIEHWKVLKNTSIDGLRETFLKRDGLITVKDNGWLLQVERKTLDVLLDSIPWGYSSIVLPWNSYLIHVEW
jgi:hypothetical protein